MKMLNKLMILMLAFSLSLASCDRNDDFINDQDSIDTGNDTGTNDDTNNDDVGNLDQFFGAQIQRSFFGQVVDENNNGISGALVKVGSDMTSTDSEGIFFLENADVNERFGYLRVTAPGYVTSGRAVLPTDGTNRIKMMLLSADVTATVNSGVAETVQLGNGTSVTLPGDFIDGNGNPYSGPVDVILDYLDPADPDLDAVMPGMLYAEDSSGDEQYLQTYGMISVELRDMSGNELNIDPNSPAELRFPLDNALQTVAPATIPLWSFDDEKGYWIEDGQATLQGNEYVGMVSHFSFWNCDAPFPVVDFCTTVTDSSGNPISNAKVVITFPGNPYPRNGVTDSSGQVCGKIPYNEVLTISIEDLCGNNIYTTNAGPFTSATTFGPMVVSPGSSTLETVVGTFNDCSNNPVANGYVVLNYAGDEFYEPVSAGAYVVNVISCPTSNNFTIEGIDLDNVQSTGVLPYFFTSPTTVLSTLISCNAVTEYAEYTIAGSTQKLFLSGISAGNQTGGTGFYVSTQTSNDYFYLSGDTTTPGTYASGLPGTPGFIIEAQIDIDYNIPNTIVYNLNNYGAIGEYIDVTFSGNYTDTNGVIQSITGSVHVIRQF